MHKWHKMQFSASITETFCFFSVLCHITYMFCVTSLLLLTHLSELSVSAMDGVPFMISDKFACASSDVSCLS